MSPTNTNLSDKFNGDCLHLYSFSKESQEHLYCYLEENFRKDLFKKFRKHFCTIVIASKILGVSEDKIRGWIIGRNVRKVRNRIIPIQASILFRIAKEMELDFNEVEKAIIAIKTKGAKAHLLKNPKLPIQLDYSLGRLLGVYLGDGYLTKTCTLVYANTSDKLIDEVIKCVNSLGNTSFKIVHSKQMRYLIVSNVIGVILKEIGAVTGDKIGKRYALKFIDGIEYMPHDFKFGLLSGLLDDEGSVIKDGKIYFEQRLPHIVEGTRKLLNEFGITTSNIFVDKVRERYYFYIYRKSERKKVLDLNLFKHPTKQERLEKIVQEDLLAK